MGPRRYGKSSITLVSPAPPADSLALGGIGDGEGSASESQSQGTSSLMGESAVPLASDSGPPLAQTSYTHVAFCEFWPVEPGLTHPFSSNQCPSPDCSMLQNS